MRSSGVQDSDLWSSRKKTKKTSLAGNSSSSSPLHSFLEQTQRRLGKNKRTVYSLAAVERTPFGNLVVLIFEFIHLEIWHSFRSPSNEAWLPLLQESIGLAKYKCLSYN
jgi:hypothetical protein